MYYSVGYDSLRYKNKYCTLTDEWTAIATGIENTGSYSLELSSIGVQDSIRLKIISGTVCDINGYYFNIVNQGRFNQKDQGKTKISLMGN